MTNPPEQSRCALFDNIKAVCILFVVLTHLPWTDVWRSRLLFPFWVDMAVPFFLLISAVLRTQKLDYNRGEGGRTRLCWSPKQLRRAFGRLMCPYIVIAVIELLADLVLHRALVPTDSAKAFLYWLCTGLTGPGSYYVPIMVQFTLFFPCIAVLFSKNRHIGLLSCFLLNLAYEFAAQSLPSTTYRLLLFRYLFLIGLGIYAAKAKKSRTEDFVAFGLFCFGALCIGGNLLHPNHWFHGWESTSMLCVPFAYGIFYALFHHPVLKNMRAFAFTICGRASYHIFLTQMLFYAVGADRLLFRWLRVLPVPFSEIFGGLLCITLCLASGVLFYQAEQAVRRQLARHTAKNKSGKCF